MIATGSRFNKMFEIRTGTYGGGDVLKNSATNAPAVARSLPANVSVLAAETAREGGGRVRARLKEVFAAQRARYTLTSTLKH